MPSEKSRYIERRMQHDRPPMEFKAVFENLRKLDSDDLADIVTHAGQYNDPLKRIMYLRAAFAASEGHDEDLLEGSLRYALRMSYEYVNYDQSSACCQVLHEVQKVLAALAERRDLDTALRLCDLALQEGENAVEWLQDSAYWDMALDDLREWRNSLRPPNRSSTFS
jgi:hypothetical protein